MLKAFRSASAPLKVALCLCCLQILSTAWALLSLSISFRVVKYLPANIATESVIGLSSCVILWGLVRRSSALFWISVSISSILAALMLIISISALYPFHLGLSAGDIMMLWIWTPVLIRGLLLATIAGLLIYARTTHTYGPASELGSDA